MSARAKQRRRLERVQLFGNGYRIKFNYGSEKDGSLAALTDFLLDHFGTAALVRRATWEEGRYEILDNIHGAVLCSLYRRPLTRSTP
jgi:hypothetical protein